MRTHYDVLGISSSSSSEEIKAAYKRLAIKYHPDKNPGDGVAEEQFKEVNNSYQVLSDPQQRSTYDFLITFQYSDASSSEANSTYSSGSGYNSPYTQTSSESEPKYTYRKKTQTRRRYSKEKEERIALIWVAAFLGVVFFLVVGAGAISSYKEEQRKQEANEKKLAVFGKAMSFFQEKNYEAALSELQAIIFQQPSSKDEATAFMQDVISAVSKAADDAFERKSYNECLQLLLLLESYEDVDSNRHYFRLAFCYKEADQLESAISTLKYILENDNRNISAMARIGAIYSEDLKNYSEGLGWYNQACNIVVRDYQQTYGKAFSMLVPPSSTPESHYTLFFSRAKAYYNLGKYKEATEDINWVTFLRPKKSNPYVLQGDCFQKLHQNQNACNAWQKASDLGNTEANRKYSQYCR